MAHLLAMRLQTSCLQSVATFVLRITVPIICGQSMWFCSNVTNTCYGADVDDADRQIASDVLLSITSFGRTPEEMHECRVLRSNYIEYELRTDESIKYRSGDKVGDTDAARLREALERLPVGVAQEDTLNSVSVSVESPHGKRTFTYDRSKLPDELLHVARIVPDSVESKIKMHASARSIAAYPANGNAMIVSPDGALIVFASASGEVKLFDSSLTQPNRSTTLPIDGGVRSLALSPDGEVLALGHASGVRILELHRTRPIAELVPFEPTCRGAEFAFVRRGRFLVGTLGNKLVAYDSTNWSRQNSVPPWDDSATRYIESDDGQWAVTSRASGSVGLWNVEHARFETVLESGYDLVSARFSPGHTLVAVILQKHGGEARMPPRLVVFDVALKKLVCELWPFDARHLEPLGIEQIAWAPDGIHLIGACRLGDFVGSPPSIHCWDVRTGRDRGAFVGHTGRCVGIGFGSVGNELVAADENGMLLFWDFGPLCRPCGRDAE